MEETTGYWLPISIWNLNDLFATESFSPFVFNQNRSFGNPSARQKEDFENEHYLTLYKTQPAADVCLRIKAEALDGAFLEDKDTHVNYRKTIYFRRGNFIVFFKDERLMKLFSVNTKMLLEVKTEPKYSYHDPESGLWKYKTFQVFKDEPKIQPLNLSAFFDGLENIDDQIFFDKAINQIKGLLFGLMRGIIGQSSETEITFENQLRTLKNEIAGSRTNILMNAGYEEDWCLSIFRSLERVTEGYRTLLPRESTRQLETLTLMLNSIDELFRKKSEVLNFKNSASYREKFSRCQSQLEAAKSRLYNLELKLGIYEYVEELKSIKEQERRNGEAKGKTRLYFPKDSYEAQRKAELKLLIDSANNHPEYSTEKQLVASLEEEVKGFQFGITEYDTTIDDQFSRISDYLSDLISKSSRTFQGNKVDQVTVPDLTGFRIDLQALIDHYREPGSRHRVVIHALPSAIEQNLSAENKELVVKALNEAFRNSYDFQGEISSDQILSFVESLGIEFKEVKSLGTEVEHLRNYFRYRKSLIDEFAFPEKNLVLQNIFAFILKPNGFEQLDKFLKERNIGSNWIAFSIWTSFLGFANLPKTFTDLIFQSEKEEVFESIDNFLFESFLTIGKS